VDVVIYAGISRLSNRLYNQGLERLKNADLTYGIESLRKSINVNKNNIPARNLLGLALHEIGHVGEALKHWVISTSLLKEENPAQGYIDKVNKNARNLEKLNDAVDMFNKAFGHIKQKSDDLAIIQLKKSVELSPRFIDAWNLLTLCYLIQGDKDRAQAAVEKVLTLDAQNPTALNYYNVLNPGRAKPGFRPAAPSKKTQTQPSLNTASYKSISMQEQKSKNFHIAEILFFIIGAGLCYAVMHFLMMPAFQQEHERDLARVSQQIEEAESAHEEIAAALNEEMEELHQQINDLTATVVVRDNHADLLDRIIRVHQAYWLFTEGQFQDSVDMLENINTVGLPFDVTRRIEDIREGSYPVIGLAHYNTGNTAFLANPRDVYLARASLEQAFYFMNDSATQWNELLFMLGSIYYDDGRLEDAHELLYDLRTRAPNHRPQTTQNLLNSINTQLEED